MKPLTLLINESISKTITINKIKQFITGIDCEIEKTSEGFTLKFDEDDYWDYENDNLTSKLQNIFDDIAKITTVIRWDDRSWLLVKHEFIEYSKPVPNEKNKVHKVNGGLSDYDEELIDLAQSTGYRSSIRKYIELADSDKARKILQDILNSNEIFWED